MSQADPRDLATEVTAGERLAAVRVEFDDFYRAELPRLVALARGLCAHRSEDVAQEAMLAAYRRWSHVGNLDHPEAWVRRACANLAVSAFRRQLVEIRATLRLSGRPSPAVELEPSAAEFWALVRELPRRQAQCAALRYVLDMEVAEIARTLEIAEGSVKVHLSRARERLARRLGESEGASS